MLLIIVLMFGMFATTPKQLGRCCIWAMTAMTAAFIAVAQAFHAALIMAVLPTVYVLASLLARIRNRLRKRKDELKEALARIEALATTDVLSRWGGEEFLVMMMDTDIQEHACGCCTLRKLGLD